MLGIVTALLSVGFIVFFLSEGEEETAATGKSFATQRGGAQRTTGARNPLQNKEAELREALFRRIAFFGSYLRSIMMKVRMKWLPVVKL